MDFQRKSKTYVDGLSTGNVGEYRNCTKGNITLYASCFAYMSYHYLNPIEKFKEAEMRVWADYILQFQQSDGLFYGPEITDGRILSPAHSQEHLAWHLTCHVLPVLSLMRIEPRKPFLFFENYLDKSHLLTWLEERDWSNAWLEGNNLLFVGQLLTYIASEKKERLAIQSLDLLFEWLNDHLDPLTGLWGTQNTKDNYAAAYGGYHQLLLYYYWKENLLYRKELVDTVLELQHFDGGFSRDWGGGSCEDVDCVDILVNMYKQIDYRRDEIDYTLLKAANAILRRQCKDGGFVYKHDEEFYHMGIEYTYAPPGVANIFSTWFGIHTMALISEIVDLSIMSHVDFQFNNSCSMGWHEKWDSKKCKPSMTQKISLSLLEQATQSYFKLRQIKRSSAMVTDIYKLLKKNK